MATSLRTGAEAIAVALDEMGVKRAFVYPGTSELALCEAIARRSQISLMNARGDREAVFLAAGANIGEPGSSIAVLHGARGLTNAIGAIAEVRRNEVRVLVLVGLASQSSAPFLPPHAEPELMGTVGILAAGAYEASSRRDGACGLIQSFQAARQRLDSLPRGPVVLGVPQDLLTSEISDVWPTPTGLRSPSVDPSDLPLAAFAIANANSPVVFVDDYALREEGDSYAIAGFADLISAPVFQVAYQRGPMLFQPLPRSRSSWIMGPFDPLAVAHRRILKSADLLITLDDRNMYPRVVGKLPACVKVAITSNPQATSKNGYLRDGDFLIFSHVRQAIADLVPLLQPATTRRRVREAPTLNETCETRQRCAPSALELMRATARALRMADVPVTVVDDSQSFGGLFARHPDELPEDSVVIGSHGGFVGSGLPTAAGAAISSPSRTVVAFVGDQGFTNGIQGLAAISEHGAPLVVVVCNNAGSVSLRCQSRFDSLDLSASYGYVLANHRHMDYAAIARGYGVGCDVIDWPDGTARTRGVIDAGLKLTQLLSAAIQRRRPHLVEIKTPGAEAFWEGTWSAVGFEGLADLEAGD